jgi:hypothetical protein
MKKIKSFLLLAVIIMAGAVAAFATNATKSQDDELVPGYLFDNSTGQCIQKRDNCSKVGVTLCTWTDAYNVSHNLSGMNGTTCTRALYEPEE